MVDFSMGFPAEQVPIQRLFFVPFSKLSKLIPHKVQFFTGVGVHKSISQTQISELLPIIAGHFPKHTSFTVHHFVVAKHLDKILRICINHTKSKLIMVVFTVNRRSEERRVGKESR